jgi:hypothetical protein
MRPTSIVLALLVAAAPAAAQQQGGFAWKLNDRSGPPAPAYNLQLAESSLGFILEPHDPLGTYTLKATVTDNVAGTTLSVQQAVTAVAATDLRRSKTE